jgi:hypothetical protein
MENDLQRLIEENNVLLKEQMTLVRENNDYLKRIHSTMRRTFYVKVAYWLAIILITAGAFYTFLPRIQNALEIYQSFVSPVSPLQGKIDLMNDTDVTSSTSAITILKKLIDSSL